MIIFGKIIGAIIAVDTNLQGFCLKCDQITGIADEVYKPISRKVLIEKSKCKRCSRIQRNYRKFSAFSTRNYQKLPNFGKATRYSKLRWTTLAPEVRTLFDIKPSQVRSMELTSGFNISKSIKNVLSKKQRAIGQIVLEGNNNVQIGGSVQGVNPYRHRPGGPTQQNPLRWRPGGTTRPRVNPMNPYSQQNYHYPSCRCNHCLDLDRERRRRYGEHNA